MWSAPPTDVYWERFVDINDYETDRIDGWFGAKIETLVASHSTGNNCN